MTKKNSAIAKIVSAAQSAVEADLTLLEKRTVNKDGSPIETIFRVALEAQVKYVFPNVLDGVIFKLPKVSLEQHCAESFNSLIVEQQAKIDRYRVDFLVLAYDFAHANWNTNFTKIAYDPGNWKRLIVECDGHEFHERTKEQAAADKSRDRHLAMSGYTVFRFTGSELWRDPMRCAEQVFDWARNDIPKRAIA